MNLPAPEFANGQEADKGSSSRNAQELQTMTNVYKMRQEQEKILQSFNTPSYSLLEFGAQNMLFFENLVSSIGSYISSESLVSSINSAVRFFFPQQKKQRAEAPLQDVDEIQQKLDFVMRQMEVVQEENKRKEAEIDLLKRQVRSTAPKPTPPPFPPELERYSQRSERSSEEAPQTIPSPTNPPSPTNLPDVLQYEEVSIETSFSTSSKPSLKPNQPPPLPFLNDIQDPETKHRLKKVQKTESKPVRKPSVNDEIRERMRERIRMLEDSEPEEDVHWRESDIF